MLKILSLLSFLILFYDVNAQNIITMDTINYKPFWKKREVQVLLKKHPAKLRNDLKDEASGFDYYEFPDGKLLLVLGFGEGTGTMYQSEEQYKKMMSEPDIRKSGEHVLSDLITDDKKFLAEKQDYIKTLVKKLNLPFEKMDYSLESLKIIDSAYRKKRPEMLEFFNKDYLYLIAYLGEVYKKEKGGDWYFEKRGDNKSFEPYIKINDKLKLDTFLGLFKECYEHFENFSTYSFAYAELMRKKD